MKLNHAKMKSQCILSAIKICKTFYKKIRIKTSKEFCAKEFEEAHKCLLEAKEVLGFNTGKESCKDKVNAFNECK